MASPALLDHWSNSRLSEDETPLNLISDRIHQDPTRYTIQRSAEYRGLWQLWDVAADTAVIATHAFVMDFASDLKTGNFVPSGEEPPTDMLEYQCKREPSMLAQLTFAFDTREDMSIYRHLKVIEDWVMKVPDFNTLKKPRSSWMSPEPTNEVHHNRYIVNSPLFQKRTAFNCPDGKYSVNYEVHPWVKQHCVPHHRSWIPNPTLVSILDGLTGTLLNIDDVPSSDLEAGDIVKMKFKITFSVNRQNWSTNLSPLQIIRVGRSDATNPFNPGFAGDNDNIVLLKPGQKLKVFEETDAEGPEANAPDNLGSPPWGPIKDEEEEGTLTAEIGRNNDFEKASQVSVISDNDSVEEAAPTMKSNRKSRKGPTDDSDRRRRQTKMRK